MTELGRVAEELMMLENVPDTTTGVETGAVETTVVEFRSVKDDSRLETSSVLVGRVVVSTVTDVSPGTVFDMCTVVVQMERVEFSNGSVVVPPVNVEITSEACTVVVQTDRVEFSKGRVVRSPVTVVAGACTVVVQIERVEFSKGSVVRSPVTVETMSEACTVVVQIERVEFSKGSVVRSPVAVEMMSEACTVVVQTERVEFSKGSVVRSPVTVDTMSEACTVIVQIERVEFSGGNVVNSPVIVELVSLPAASPVVMVVVETDMEKSPGVLEAVPFATLVLGVEIDSDEFVNGAEPVTGESVTDSLVAKDEVVSVPVGYGVVLNPLVKFPAPVWVAGEDATLEGEPVEPGVVSGKTVVFFVTVELKRIDVSTLDLIVVFVSTTVPEATDVEFFPVGNDGVALMDVEKVTMVPLRVSVKGSTLVAVALPLGKNVRLVEVLVGVTTVAEAVSVAEGEDAGTEVLLNGAAVLERLELVLFPPAPVDDGKVVGSPLV